MVMYMMALARASLHLPSMTNIGGREGRVADPATRERLGAYLVCGTVFLLPLACLPGLGRPFSLSKMILLACLDLSLAAVWLTSRSARRDPPAGEWLALGWVAAVSLSALTGAGLTLDGLILALLPVPTFFGAGRGLVAAECLAQAIWLGSVCQAAIVVLQYCGTDPLQWLGWRPEVYAGSRMRVYGTMGNPDFVAAWCCATLPFCVREAARAGLSRSDRSLRWAAAALQIAAILATGSRVFAFIIPLQSAMLTLSWKRVRRAWLLAPAAAAALLYLAPARPLATTIEGRLYLARVTAGNLQESLTGHGPGSFEGRFAVWQAAWLRERHDPDAARFAGQVDHAHNDYLEFMVEYGPAGLGVFLCLAGWVTAQASRGRAQPVSSVRTAAAMGAVSLLVIAVVDFPFHRPAEWGLFWLLAGILAGRETQAQGA